MQTIKNTEMIIWNSCLCFTVDNKLPDSRKTKVWQLTCKAKSKKMVDRNYEYLKFWKIQHTETPLLEAQKCRHFEILIENRLRNTKVAESWSAICPV